MKWIVIAISVLFVAENSTAAERWFQRSRARVVVRQTTSQCSNGQCQVPTAQPVESKVQCSDGSCEIQTKPQPVRSTLKAIGFGSRIINRNQAAYNHALKEATYLAERCMVGHPFGVAPGCNKAGTGCSSSEERPNHCFMELPESRIVARAVVRGRDGRFYWSAHYR